MNRFRHLRRSRHSFRRRHPHLYYLIAGTAIVIFWRGVWGLLDTYFLPDYHLLSLVASVVAGIVILYLDDFSLEELA